MYLIPTKELFNIYKYNIGPNAEYVKNAMETNKYIDINPSRLEYTFSEKARKLMKDQFNLPKKTTYCMHFKRQMFQFILQNFPREKNIYESNVNFLFPELDVIPHYGKIGLVDLNATAIIVKPVDHVDKTYSHIHL